MLVRSAAFDFLREKSEGREGVILRTTLERGFEFKGARVPLIGPQGIFKPKILEVPISITSTAIVEGQPRPYEDELGADGFLRYRYRGTDPMHRDNVGLRRAMQERIPLIYHHGVMPGKYLSASPVYVVGDEPGNLTFTIAVDEPKVMALGERRNLGGDDVRRRYVTREVTQRLHQQDFRYRVLAAYRQQCAICKLKHRELLDAAHILPDGHPDGTPIVANGLSLCKLHHAAFDSNLIGIRPDLKIQVRQDILQESDGPMLRHGLQEIAGESIWVPRSSELQPKTRFLEQRYESFLVAN
jgi:putative restriction endonuclease